MDKYHEAISKFKAPLADAEITERVNNLIDASFKENYTTEVLKTIHGCIDLTSLTSIDNKESILQLVNRVNDFDGLRPDVPNVASICTYPVFVETVKQALTADEVKITSVAGGFPSSQTFMEIKIAEVAMAKMEGAEELDVVLNLGYFFEENYEDLCIELSEIKDTCRETTLKVILETGALVTAQNIQHAAVLALYCGADFLKTSTGKGYPGASFESVYTLCQVLKEYQQQSGKKIGIKISGGIQSAEEAVKYYTIVKEVLGVEWLMPAYLRFGASILSADILQKLA